MKFKYHYGNTDHRFFWQRDGLTDEDYEIMRLGCVPTITQERETKIDGQRDYYIMVRWTRTCTAMRKHGLDPTIWKIKNV